MFVRLSRAHRTLFRLIALCSFAWLAACDAVNIVAPTQNTGQAIDPDVPVQVALLVPGGSGVGSDQFLANNLENAARLAIADLQGVSVDLRVYNTGSDPAQAASVATAAVDDGAKIILGPLFAEAANAAGVAVAGRNVNVLAFSNNTSIAGGNVFVLGATFENTADRLVQYAAQQGITRFAVVHGDDVAGQAGRDAITSAVRSNGAQVAGSDRAHHVVAAAGRDRDALRKTELAGCCSGDGSDCSDICVQRRQALLKIAPGINCFQHRGRPAAIAYVQEPGSGSIAHLHATLACEHKIEIVMRQQNAVHLLVQRSPVLSQPADF